MVKRNRLKPEYIAVLCIAALCTALPLCPRASADDLRANFAAPPAAARPWVYWFWPNGNITKPGITADLEAMQRVGIGGVLVMEVDQGTPLGPVASGGPKWREMFQFVCSEAHRLGLQVNMNNDAGWCGLERNHRDRAAESRDGAAPAGDSRELLSGYRSSCRAYS